MVVQRFARLWTNLGISQDICYVRTSDNNYFLTIYRHRANLLNNNFEYLYFFPTNNNDFKTDSTSLTPEERAPVHCGIADQCGI